MRFVLALLAGVAYAQAPPGTLKTLDELRALVEAGAAPRAQLERAEAESADAGDAAFLRRTLYGDDLTEEVADDMVAVAQRRLDRKKASLEEAKRLVAEGVLPRLSLGDPLQAMDRARKELDLAHSRAKLVRELAEMARAEEAAAAAMVASEPAPPVPGPIAERYDGDGFFTRRNLKEIVLAFEGHFAKPLPISANGATALHRALGFDHRDRVDVALHPDEPEGVWLRRFLEANRIPYFAFRSAVRGKSTAPHIHIGPMSARLAGVS
ncbi:MAG: hypothetical protein WD696_08895 [Bryobacteraceae bacterium]